MRSCVAVAAVVLVAACGSPQQAGPPPAATGPTAASPETEAATPRARKITISIENGTIDPAPGRVDVAEGEKVRIEVISDRADEAHLHGYDLTAKIGPGEAGTIEFTADRTGLFELETHGDGTLLTQLVVR